MIQHGQVFKLKTKGADGEPLWAYRYRLEGRGSERPQVGGFATREEAKKALRKVLDRLGPGGGRATITLGEFVDEYLEMHQAAPVTVAKLRWLLGKATAALGEKRLAELSPQELIQRFDLAVRKDRRALRIQPNREIVGNQGGDISRQARWGISVGDRLVVGDQHEQLDAERLQVDTVLERPEVVAEVQRTGRPVTRHDTERGRFTCDRDFEFGAAATQAVTRFSRNTGCARGHRCSFRVPAAPRTQRAAGGTFWFSRNTFSGS